MKFKLGQTAVIEVSGEEGVVIGRAEYQHGEPTFLLRYRRADGLAHEEWWAGSALNAVDDNLG